MWTLDVGELPSSALVALAIGITWHDQRHVGVLYRPTVAAPPRFLHLAGHWHLSDEERVPDGFRGVLIVDVPAAVQPTIVAHCKRTADADVLDGLPYGFGYKPTTVSRDPITDKLVLRGPSGLTCATFVLAMFELAGVDLANLATWQDRPGDDAWKKRIIGHLTPRLNEEELNAIKMDRTNVRVRLEDTAGCATVAPLPSNFTQAVDRSAELLAELA